MAESTVSRSVTGSCCSASQRRPLTPNRSDAGGRSFRQRINTAWISFFARERARTSCARRASRRRIARMRSSGVHTPSSWPAHSSLASARASRRSVFARAWRMPVSLGETTITRATCGSRIRAISHALPVTSNATQSRGSRLCANSSNASGRACDPAGRAQPALRDDRDLAEVAMHVQRYRSHLASSPSLTRGRTGGQTTSTDPRSQRNRASRRGGH